ncbi:gluconate 2-dehydrogenase subunit 3 family protein [Aurantiacibacter flavus]|uniref:Gluconate 2-dehydrogenase subunit 3 family protein n=1 Tax=Aurantiacibacter flavus TaxID=3145232 RepID=A0ABV0CT02_9SPHN
MLDMTAIDRRALIVRALALVGAGAAASAWQTLEAAAPAVAASGEALSSTERTTLAAAVGRIIPETDTPGAIQVGVPERFEGMLETWASTETRADFRRVLADIDGLSGDGRHFAALPEREQHDLLAAHDARAMQPDIDPAYRRFKDLVVTLYFMSQKALSSELPYTHVPGRWEPSVPVTSDTRAQAQLSYFF